MIYLWIILGIVVYIAIGGVFAGFIDAADDLNVVCALAWPIPLILALFSCLFCRTKEAAKNLREFLVDLCTGEESSNE